MEWEEASSGRTMPMMEASAEEAKELFLIKLQALVGEAARGGYVPDAQLSQLRKVVQELNNSNGSGSK